MLFPHPQASLLGQRRSAMKVPWLQIWLGAAAASTVNHARHCTDRVRGVSSASACENACCCVRSHGGWFWTGLFSELAWLWPCSRQQRAAMAPPPYTIAHTQRGRRRIAAQNFVRQKETFGASGHERRLYVASQTEFVRSGLDCLSRRSGRVSVSELALHLHGTPYRSPRASSIERISADSGSAAAGGVFRYAESQ